MPVELNTYQAEASSTAAYPQAGQNPIIQPLA